MRPRSRGSPRPSRFPSPHLRRGTPSEAPRDLPSLLRSPVPERQHEPRVVPPPRCCPPSGPRELPPPFPPGGSPEGKPRGGSPVGKAPRPPLVLATGPRPRCHLL